MTDSSHLQRMRAMATGLLVVMAGVYAAARTFEPAVPWLVWVRAFAEAAMVGALADWFAVVALFRHPLGLPIPHTAVIPRRKAQIARSLGDFVQRNFLTPDRIVEKLRALDPARRLAEWLTAPGTAEALAERVTEAAPQILDALDEDGMRTFLRAEALTQLRRVPLAPVTGKILGVLAENGRDQELFAQAVRIIRQTVGEHQPLITEKISEELSAIPNWPGVVELKSLVARGLAEKIVEKVQGTLDDILGAADHPVRARFSERAAQWIEELKSSPEMAARAEALKENLLTNATLNDSLDALWTAVRREFLRDLADPDSRVRRQVAETFRRVGEVLAEDAAFRSRCEAWMESAVRRGLDAHGSELAALVRETVERWDAREVAEKLEAQVGADLQFIRINGTVVGGAVGVAIHAASQVIW